MAIVLLMFINGMYVFGNGHSYRNQYSTYWQAKNHYQDYQKERLQREHQDPTFAINENSIEKFKNGMMKKSDTDKFKSCMETYNDLFSDGTLNFSIGVGYIDSAGDGSLRVSRQLDAAYRKILDSQGFRRKDWGPMGSPTTYVKDVSNPHCKVYGGDCEPRKIEVRIGHSNGILFNRAFEEKDANLVPKTSGRSVFYDAIKEGHEIVAYVGHNEYGIEPRFAKPGLNTDGRVDYKGRADRFAGKSPFIDAIESAQDVGKGPKLLVLHSCSSETWKRKKVGPPMNTLPRPSQRFEYQRDKDLKQAIRNGLSTMFTTQLSDSNRSGALLGGFLRNISNYECRSGFERTMDIVGPGGGAPYIEGALFNAGIDRTTDGNGGFR